MSDLLNGDEDVMASLLLALCDPGRIIDREPHEPLVSWQRRAVIEHAAPYIRAEAVRLVTEALHLAVNGERAPGGNETWAGWERAAETYLRGLAP